MSSRRALISGIAGQDGSYLAELLLSKGYDVHGLVRSEALESPETALPRIAHLLSDVRLHPVSLEDYASVFQIAKSLQPDECYHLAARSFVSYGFTEGYPALQSNIAITHCLLSAISQACADCRVYYAGSSEMFGQVDTVPQNETTRFNPRSLYGISKVAGHHLATNFRRSLGLFTATGILYNHESPRRGDAFVTQKIARGVARIALGKAKHLELGNLTARRDWGHAKDYVVAMWKLLQLDRPMDVVVATGVTHSVEEFVAKAFAAVGLEPAHYLQTSEKYFRGAEHVELRGDPRLAREVLQWTPEYSVDNIVEEMVRAAMERESRSG